MNQSDQTNSPSSIRAYKAFCAHRTTVHHVAIKCFTIYEHLTPCFIKYFLNRLKASEVLESIREGKLIKESTSFLVVYVTPRGTILEELEKNPQAELLLSFRAANPVFSLPAYVLVKLAESVQLPDYYTAKLRYLTSN